MQDLQAYVVVEVQTAADGTVATLVTSHRDQNEAESAYHGVLAAAAISAVPMHGAVMFANDGIFMEGRCYRHETEGGAA